MCELVTNSPGVYRSGSTSMIEVPPGARVGANAHGTPEARIKLKFRVRVAVRVRHVYSSVIWGFRCTLGACLEAEGPLLEKPGVQFGVRFVARRRQIRRPYF